VTHASLLAIILALMITPMVPAVPPATGTIAGRVEIHHKTQPVVRRPDASDLGMSSPRHIPDQRHSVVYLETAPRGAFEEREGGRARMDQRNETFVPHVLAITVGTTVDFPNSDQTYHNVFSLSKTKPFDLGRYAAGRSKSVRFDRPGIVRVFCDIHSHMSAFILVFGHGFFSVTDDEGRYRIDDVPPGTYTVVVWNELLPQVSRQVTVPSEGGIVDLDFSLGSGGS
jgi:plastocyanin